MFKPNQVFKAKQNKQANQSSDETTLNKVRK